MDLYREEILEHWRSPNNFGKMANADLIVDQINPLCGDQVRFYFKFSGWAPVTTFLPASARSRTKSVRAQSTTAELRAVVNPSSRATPFIEDVSFVGNGCAISIASASILSTFIRGKSVGYLSKITGADVLELLGGPVAPARLKCAFLPLEALRQIFSRGSKI